MTLYYRYRRFMCTLYISLAQFYTKKGDKENFDKGWGYFLKSIKYMDQEELLHLKKTMDEMGL